MMNRPAIEFIRDLFAQDKPVAAICHGPWTLVEADVVRGRTVTSWPSLKADIWDRATRRSARNVRRR